MRNTQSIKCSKQTHERFEKMGQNECKFGDSYDTWLNKLMDTYNRHKELVAKTPA